MKINLALRDNKSEKAAGEFFATKQNSYQLSPIRADGLRARDKDILKIL